MLDYESPYAEYLPARFREWAPEAMHAPLRPKSPNTSVQEHKIIDLSHIYGPGGADVTHSHYGGEEGSTLAVPRGSSRKFATHVAWRRRRSRSMRRPIR